MMRSLYGVRRTLRFLFPIRCACCEQVMDPHKSGMCPSCLATARVPQVPLCIYCGQDDKECVCPKRERYYARCSAAFYYEGSVRRAVFHLKDQGSLTAAQVLGYHMYRMLRRDMPHLQVDAIVPVPLSRDKKRVRGFNQSLMLCRALAHYMNKPVLQALKRRNEENWIDQKQLPRVLRSGNVLGAFEPADDVQVRDKVLLLVDDTRTTGSTIDECAKVLRMAGAKAVYVSVAATVPMKKEKDDK